MSSFGAKRRFAHKSVIFRTFGTVFRSDVRGEPWETEKRIGTLRQSGAEFRPSMPTWLIDRSDPFRRGIPNFRVSRKPYGRFF